MPEAAEGKKRKPKSRICTQIGAMRVRPRERICRRAGTAADRLDDADDGHPVVVDHEERPGACVAGRHRGGDGGFNFIEAEDKEHEAKNTAESEMRFQRFNLRR